MAHAKEHNKVISTIKPLSLPQSCPQLLSKQKAAVHVRMQGLKTIYTVFKLQCHVIIVPVSLLLCTKLKKMQYGESFKSSLSSFPLHFIVGSTDL